MKIFAFYLPQFHTIPENDKWWGEGFTEWVNVKKGKPLFFGHQQPIHPLNENYYNLLDPSTALWQTSLMKEYGIDGLVYYHYYFDGKLLLEKPAENLLQNKDLEQPFFFCWANHSWRRSWEGKSEILIEQTYGDIKSWEKHFQYLLPFFKDERYEKKNNKPLLMFFDPFFKEKAEMVSYFNKRCIEEGFFGISVIDTISNIYSDKYNNYLIQQHFSDYVFFREPAVGQFAFQKKHKIAMLMKRGLLFLRKKCRIGNYVLSFSGNKLLKEVTIPIHLDKKFLKGLFFEWDNTPRHGYRGYLIKPVSKKGFLQYMREYSNQDYVFINAWNEWCEGMVLEPTQEFGYKYLEWIKEWRDKNCV